jgi:hypothetical protein
MKYLAISLPSKFMTKPAFEDDKEGPQMMIHHFKILDAMASRGYKLIAVENSIAYFEEKEDVG